MHEHADANRHRTSCCNGAHVACPRDAPTANTLIGVASLWLPDLLVEVKAIVHL